MPTQEKTGEKLEKTDEELMLMTAKDDQTAFEQLVVRHQKPLLNFFYRLGVYTDAEDLVQLTFVRLYRYRAKYSPDAKFTTFLYLLARQVRVDEVRKRIRLRNLREKLAEESRHAEPVQADAPYTGASDDLQAALSQLSEAHREVVVLGMLQDLPYTEVSEILDVPVGTVKSRMFHALRTLRRILEA